MVDPGFFYKYEPPTGYGDPPDWIIGYYDIESIDHITKSEKNDIFFAICERCQERGWQWTAIKVVNGYGYRIQKPDPTFWEEIAYEETPESAAHAALLAYLQALESLLVDCPECLDGAVVLGPDGHGLEIEPCKHCNGTGKAVEHRLILKAKKAGPRRIQNPHRGKRWIEEAF